MKVKFNVRSKIFIIILALLLICFGVTFFLVINRRDTTSVNMDFVINDTLADGDGQNVKVILLAGQSNAEGVARTSYLKNNVSEDKYAEYQNGYDSVFINYYNGNGINSSNGFTNVTLDQGCEEGYFGPELGMAEKLSYLYPDENIFIIKYAWGGSNLHTQWNKNIGNLYKAFIKYVNESMKYLKDKNYDAEIVAMMWMQGESDSGLINSLKYKRNLDDMIKSLREELKQYIQKEGMYFIDAYISSSPYWKYYKNINKAKQTVCDSSRLNVCIDTISENLSFDKEPINGPDMAHYDSLSEIKLGYLFVEKLYELMI